MPKWYHRASWALAKGLYSPTLLRRYRVEAKGLDSLPEPPFLLAAGHANFLDPFILGSLVRGPVRFMANLEGVSALGAAVSGLAGCYGRRKGASDIRALRRTFELAASGESIGIFPEGDRSWDGAALPLRPGCGKLARRLGLPLVLARQKGNYLAHPRWASRARRGRWSVEFLVFGADELSRMTDGTAEAIIALALARNEIKDAQREGRRFEGERCAEGVGRLLWRCPVCGKADCIEGRAETIRCSRCLSRWELDANCRVRPLNAPLSIHAAEIGDLERLARLAGRDPAGTGLGHRTGTARSPLGGRHALRALRRRRPDDGKGRPLPRGLWLGSRARLRGPLRQGRLQSGGGAGIRRQLQRVFGVRPSGT